MPRALKLPEFCTFSSFSHTLHPCLSDSLRLFNSGVSTYNWRAVVCPFMMNEVTYIMEDLQSTELATHRTHIICLFFVRDTPPDMSRVYPVGN